MSSIRRHFINFGLGTSIINRQNSSDNSRSSNNIPFKSVTKEPIGPSPPSSVSNEMDCQFPMNQKLSFIHDIGQCLELCSAYIQTLNQLCSSGAVLAQSLIQVFSREYFQNCNPNGSNMSYYEISEKFLTFWELMSVATAGASATVKTETSMTLQELLNKMENDDESDPKNEFFNDCINSAICCLQSYIELQSQFSLSSFQSFSTLSDSLNSGTTSDISKDVRRHFANCNYRKEFNLISDGPNANLAQVSPVQMNNLPQISPVQINNLTQVSPAQINNLVSQSNQSQSQNFYKLTNDLSPSPGWSSINSINSINSNNYVSSSSDQSSVVLDDVINLLSLKSNLPNNNVPNNKLNQMLSQNISQQSLANQCNEFLLSRPTGHQENLSSKSPLSPYNEWQLWTAAGEAIEANNDHQALQAWNSLSLGDNISSSGSGSEENVVMNSIFDSANNMNSNNVCNLFVDQFLQQNQNSEQVKRLSSSSDGLEGALTSLGLNEIDSYDAFASAFTPDFNQIRIAKTSTWPLKQNSLNSFGLVSNRQFQAAQNESWQQYGPNLPSKYFLFDNNKVP